MNQNNRTHIGILWEPFLTKNGLIKLFFIILFAFLNQLAVYATDYSGGVSALTTAISAAGTNTYTPNAEITLSSNVGAMNDTALTIYGSNYNLNGNSKSGITVATNTQSLSVLNYGSINTDDSVVSSINGFVKSSSASFLSTAGSINISSSVFYNNTVSESSTATNLTTNGGLIYDSLSTSATNDTAVVFTNSKFFKNKVTGTNSTTNLVNNSSTVAGGVIANVVTMTGTGKSLTIGFSGNAFGSSLAAYGNVAEAINSSVTTAYTTTVTVYGGAIYNSLSDSGVNSNMTVNINGSNSFTANKAIATNTATNTTSANYAYSYGGAVANYIKYYSTGTSTYTNIIFNAFKTNSAEATNTATPSSTGSSDATSYGGAIYNYIMTNVNSITSPMTVFKVENNILGGDLSEGNMAKSVNNSKALSGTNSATAMGGALYSEISSQNTRNMTDVKIDLNKNSFLSNSAYSILQDNVGAVGSTSIGNKTSTAQGGAIATKLTLSNTSAVSKSVTDIKGNTFGISSLDSNTAKAYNTTTTSTIPTVTSTSQGGAVYNTVSLSGSNLSEINIGRTKLLASDTTGDTDASAVDDSSSDNNFYYNRAYAENSSQTAATAAAGGGGANVTGSGGAIYNTATLSGTTADVINLKYNTFNSNVAASKNISNTTSSTTYTSGSTNAYSYGGALYGTTTLSNSGIHTLNLYNNNFVANYANALNNSTSTNTSTGQTGSTASTAYGGAVYNYVTESGTTSYGVFDVKNNVFGGDNSSDGNGINVVNNSLSVLGTYTTTGYGGAIYNELVTTTTASATNVVTFDSNDFKNNKVISTIENNANTTSTTKTKTVNAMGGAIYNKISLNGSGATGTINFFNNTFDGNKIVATNSNTSTTVSSNVVTAVAAAIYHYVSSSNQNTAVTTIGSYENPNYFYNNSITAINSGTTTTASSSATAQGGALKNSEAIAGSGSNSVDINYNVFQYNSVTSTNSSTSSSTSATSPGATVAYSYGGVIYNMISLTGAGSSITNINNNTFSDNTSSVTNSSDTTGSLSGGYTYSYNYGGVLYNSVSSTSTVASPNSNQVNIKDNIFSSNNIYVANSSKSNVNGKTYAYSSGGIIYNTMNASGTGMNSNIVNISGNEISDNTITISNSSTTTANAYSYFYGLVYNVVNATGTGTNSNTLNISDNTFENNTVNITNTSTSPSKTTTTYGGAIYNDIDALSTSAVSNNINITDNKFLNNSATSGGAIFNDITQTGNGINVLNIKGTFLDDSIFDSNTAAMGGAIYNYSYITTAGTSASNTDFNIENTKFYNNQATTGIGGGIYNYISTTTSGVFNETLDFKDDSFDTNIASGTTNARGGALNNTISASHSSTNATNIVGSVNYTNTSDNTSFENNKASTSTSGTSTALGGAIFNIMTATISASSSGSSSFTGTLASIMKNSSSFDNNAAISVSTGATVTNTAESRGGAYYVESNIASTSTSATTSITEAAAAVVSSVFDNASVTNNYASATAVSIAYTYGGAIHNRSVTNVTASNVSSPVAHTTSTLSITNHSNISSNRAVSSSTGSSATTLAASAFGGAIHNFSSTTASATSSGTALSDPTMDIIIDTSTVSNNYASASAKSTATTLGGAIYNYVKSTATETVANTVTGSNIMTTAISGSTFEGNYAYSTSTGNLTSSNAISYGGAIYNFATAITKGIGRANLDIDNNSYFKDNYVSASSSNYGANAYGGAIYNSIDSTSTGVVSCDLNIANTTFEGNHTDATAKGNSGSAAAYSNGGAIYNTQTATISDSSFINNKANATGTISSSYAKGFGGAIYNTGNMTITGSSFTGNTATTSGGAIYNTGNLYIIDNNASTNFSGNIANSVSNAIHLAGGNLYLNVGVVGQIKFDDAISSSAIGNTIYVNKTDLSLPYLGNVIFNNKVSDASVYLYGGMLTFGETGSTITNTYLSNVNINLQSGIVNLENGLATDVLNLNNITSAATSSIYFDANLETGENDKINVATSAAGTLTTGRINILTDGSKPTLTLFTGGISPVLTSLITYTTNFEYTFSPSSAGIYSISRRALSGFHYAAENDVPYRLYSATEDSGLLYSVGTMAGAGSTLEVLGNYYSLNGLGYSGIKILSGQTFNVTNVGSLNADNTIASSINGFVSVNGAFADNDGTIAIDNSIFQNNQASAFGGVLHNTGNSVISDSYFNSNSASSGGVVYNTGNVTVSDSEFKSNTATSGGAIFNTGDMTVTDSCFKNNTATTSGGAIYNSANLYIVDNKGVTEFSGNTVAGTSNAIHLAGGSLYLNASSSGTILFNDKITSTSIGNQININKTDLSLPYGGNIIFNNLISDSTVNLYSGNLKFNPSASNAITTYLSNSNLNLYGGILNLENGVTTDVLNVKNIMATAASSVYFDVNLSTGESDTINVSDSATGTLTTGKINVINNGDAESITLFTGGIAPNLTKYSIYTTDSKYSFVPSDLNPGVYEIKKISSSGINYAVEEEDLNRSFSATAQTNTEGTLGVMGGAGSNFSILGNKYSINGLGDGGIEVLSGQTLNLENVGKYDDDDLIVDSFNGFKSINGGGIKSNGTLSLLNSIFYNNNASSSGGALYNSGLANISKSDFVSNSASLGGAIYNTGVAVITDSSFKNNEASSLGGAIYNSGTMSIIADSAPVEFTNNTDSSGSNAIYLDGGATLNLNSLSNSPILLNDKISSSSLSNNININRSSVMESDGVTVAPTNGTVFVNNQISNSGLNLYGGSLSLAKDSLIDGNNLNLNGGYLNLINGATGAVSLNGLNVQSGTTTNLGIDINLENSSSDRILANTYSGSGLINLSNVNILTDKSGSHNFSIIDKDYGNLLTSSVTSAWGPIFKYNLNYEPTTGVMGVSAVSGGDYHNYNPEVISKTVSSLTGSYLTQVNTYTESLGRAEFYMTLPASDRFVMKYQNKYASAGSEPVVFSPLFLPEQRGGLWLKEYTTFENVPLINGPNVSSTSYGALVGADTPLTYLKRGYSGYMTGFAGYNGSSQDYTGVRMNQNGGQLGLTGAVYKGNFFAALTASVGANIGETRTNYGTDSFNTLVAGGAVKTGYNFECLKGKMIVQPSYAMSYTYANTFDYTAASGVRITSDPLNAIQITPGLKLIANLKNGWQPYIGVNMVFSLMDKQKFYASDVPLPQMSIAPYVEYGVGVQRRWGKRFTGFGQCMLRDGGRNGVSLQFGFRYAVGK